jgi:two-component system, cell cycle sensor histidine kinase and response regulator CckA
MTLHSVPLKIVHLEDSPNDALLIEALIGEEFHNFSIVQVDTQEAFLKAIQDPGIRIVLSDYSLPAYDGLAALAALRNLRPELPFIFVSGDMGEDMAVECMKIGATDYVLKSNLKRLPSAIRRALSELNARLALTDAARVAKVVPWRYDEEGDTWLFGYLVRDILGYPPEVLKSTPGFLKSKVHAEDVARFNMFFALAKERDRVDFDCRLEHGDGHWLWTRWILAWSDGRCRGVLQDITELHSAQDALIQSQRIETLGTMIGGITHDFGNLIASMSGATQVLAMSPLTEKQQRHVEILAKSCERAMEFKRELLRLARREDAPVRLPVDLNEVTQEAVTLLGHALPKSMELNFQPCENLPLVQGVHTQLLQVLMNLGINARDAMVDKGRLMLRTGLMEFSNGAAEGAHRAPGKYAFVDVEDTGPGIPTEVLPRIFEPFFTTKGEEKGTGLGLAIARAIIHQHDGLLKVDTAPEQGTCFRVLLPLAC